MSQELTEADIKTLNEGRMMRVESEILLPLLRQRRESAIQKLIGIFKSEEQKGILAATAEISCLEDMLTTITNKIKRAELIERKIHGQ